MEVKVRRDGSNGDGEEDDCGDGMLVVTVVVVMEGDDGNDWMMIKVGMGVMVVVIVMRDGTSNGGGVRGDDGSDSD